MLRRSKRCLTVPYMSHFVRIMTFILTFDLDLEYKNEATHDHNYRYNVLWQNVKCLQLSTNCLQIFLNIFFIKLRFFENVIPFIFFIFPFIKHVDISFLVKGCADPPTDGGASLTRSGDIATLSCSGSSDQSWQLTCNKSSGEWLGEQQTCQQGMVGLRAKRGGSDGIATI